MQLEKFYVDVVGPDGSGCLGYAVRLDGFGIAATIAATQRWSASASGPIIQQRTLLGRLPAVDERGLTWHCPALGLEGTWSGRERAGAEQTLWIDTHRGVHWQPLAPRAAVTMRLGDLTISGWGYAERMRLDLAPWQLPIDALRWGRFVSPAHSAVWIEWEHATPRRWLWHNGIERPPLAITDTGIAWCGWRLDFGTGRILRSGQLADTVFAHWPGMRRCLPKRIQAYDESKWCAPGTLTAENGRSTQGWVIHEYVRLQ